MTTSFTKQMLFATSLLTGLTAAYAAPVIPQHLAHLPRVEKTSKFKSTPRNASETAEECAVFIQLPEDLQDWMPDICVACAPNKPIVNPSGDYLYLAPGTYDIVARFTHSNFLSYTYNDYTGYIVLENVEVNGDMSINLDPSTITNHIKFQPLLPDGKPMELPVVNIDEDNNEIPVSDGSMPFGSLTILDYIVGPGWGIDSSNTMSAVIHQETPWGFYDPTQLFGIHINDVSERIHLGMGTWISTPEYDMASTLIMIAEQAGSEAGVVSNNASEYKVRDFNPSWTPAGKSTAELIEQYPEDLGWITPYGYALRRIAGDTNRLTSGMLMTDSKTPDIYSMAFSRNQIANPMVHLIVAPTKTELVKDGSNVIQTVNYGAWCQPFNDGEWIVYPQTSLAMTKDSPTADFPFAGVETFSIAVKDNKDQMFLTAPLLSTTINRGFNPFEGTEYFEFNITSTGRMGETRNTDLSLIEADMRVNGVKVANSMEAISEWWKGYEADMAGETELKLTVSNFEIEDISASTVSTTHFNMGNEDFFPPSVTMMQVRTSEGELSSCVEGGLNNTITVSAGDFEAGTEMINYYGQTAKITSEPASFNMWYAPTGTEEWIELDCTKISEEAINGIGAIYEAVINEKVEGWKDIKIRVEDTAGNWQEQVVGMAVYVSKPTGIQTIDSDCEVTVNGNNIITPADAQIYTIQGIRTNGNNLTSGIYIVRVADRTYKVYVK